MFKITEPSSDSWLTNVGYYYYYITINYVN